MARAMKDSGIEWIGEIPEGWKRVNLGFLYSFSSGDTLTAQDFDDSGDYPVFGANGQRGHYNSFNTSGKHILIGRVGALCGNIHLINSEVWVTEHALISEKLSSLVTDEFSVYLLTAMGLRQYASGTAQPVIAAEKIRKLSVPLPPMNEQQRIANHLDSECVRIDMVIEQTRASIEEYKKLKQSVITEAVTKGIRPGRKMKDSGVDWIGVVPEEWAVTKLKYFSRIRSGITLGKTYPRDTKLVEYPYLRVANVQGSYTDLTDVATILVTEEEAEKYRLHNGELLMTEGGDRDKLGRGTVWHAEIDPCLHQNHVFALTTNDDLSAEYVSFLSASFVGRDYFDVTANQSVHLASTNSTTILNFTIPVPLIEEQNEIVSYLTEKTEELEKLIAKKQELISDLESYKKSLIFEYVTGKKEVQV